MKKPKFEPTCDEVTYGKARAMTKRKLPGTYQCRACDVEFKSPAVFDSHRYGRHGNRGCLTVPFLLRHGFRLDDRGVVMSPEMPEEALVAIQAR